MLVVDVSKLYQKHDKILKDPHSFPVRMESGVTCLYRGTQSGPPHQAWPVQQLLVLYCGTHTDMGCRVFPLVFQLSSHMQHRSVTPQTPYFVLLTCPETCFRLNLMKQTYQTDFAARPGQSRAGPGSFHCLLGFPTGSVGHYLDHV